MTNQELIQEAAVIRDERNQYANTAERVGTALVHMAEQIAAQGEDVDKIEEDVRGALTLAQLDNPLGFTTNMQWTQGLNEDKSYTFRLVDTSGRCIGHVWLLNDADYPSNRSQAARFLEVVMCCATINAETGALTTDARWGSPRIYYRTYFTPLSGGTPDGGAPAGIFKWSTWQEYRDYVAKPINEALAALQQQYANDVSALKHAAQGLEKKTSQIEHTDAETLDEEWVWCSEDEEEDFAKIGPYGIRTKNLQYRNGEKLFAGNKIGEEITPLKKENKYFTNAAVGKSIEECLVSSPYGHSTYKYDISIYDSCAINIDSSNSMKRMTIAVTDKEGTIIYIGDNPEYVASANIDFQRRSYYLYVCTQYSSWISITAILNARQIASQVDGLLRHYDDNPLAIIRRDGGMAGSIVKWGIIGDSLSAGGFGANVVSEDHYEFAWGAYMGRLTGTKVSIFARGGETTQSWFGWSGGSAAALSNKCQGYIIALGHNDLDQIKAGKYSLGNADTDINLEDMSQNAGTFAGYYGKIIQTLRSMAQTSSSYNLNPYIFVVTDPQKPYADINNVIRRIAELFDRVYVIDLYRFAPNNQDTRFAKKYWYSNHLNCMGYLYTAYMITTYIDWIMNNYPNEFKNAHMLSYNKEVFPESVKL